MPEAVTVSTARSSVGRGMAVPRILAVGTSGTHRARPFGPVDLPGAGQ